MTITCTKKYIELPFAHRQHSHPGHCKHIHGHNWTFEFTFSADYPNAQGFVVDFGGLKWLKEWIDNLFDHTIVLNSDDPLVGQFHSVGGDDAWNITVVPDASSEGLAKFLFEQVNKMLKEAECVPEGDKMRRVRVVNVTVYEDSRNSANCTYVPPPR